MGVVLTFVEVTNPNIMKEPRINDQLRELT